MMGVPEKLFADAEAVEVVVAVGAARVYVQKVPLPACGSQLS